MKDNLNRFPECYTSCKSVKILGASECSNVCPNKFQEVNSMEKSQPPLHVIIEESWTSNTLASETLHRIKEAGYHDISLRYVIQRFSELDKAYFVANSPFTY